MNRRFVFKKNDYPELVIRNSLYWLSEKCKWHLSESEDEWIIRIKDNIDDIEFDLSRLLNDFKLRYQIDVETKGIRRELIRSALHAIASRK